jgi:hypothetical protein
MDEEKKKNIYIYISHTHIHTMGWYSAMKKSEMMWLAGQWMELEIITLSETCQAQRVRYCMFLLICGT